MKLPTDSKARKAAPITRGLLDYFPLACAAVARLSLKGNDKHNPGQPMHWAREKSTDHADCVARHLIDRGTIEPESGELHDVCQAWRSLAQCELAEEKRIAAQAERPDTNTTVGKTTPQIGVTWGDPYTGSDVTTGSAMPPPALAPALGPKVLIEGKHVTLLDPNRNGPFGMSLPECAGARVGTDGQFWMPVKAETKKFTFWYLATPYSKYPLGHESASRLSEKMAAIVMEERVPVFAPIAHSHPISKYVSTVSNTDHDFWINADAPFIEAASGLIVVTAAGWEQSKGMAEEIKRFTAAGKPVVYWDPLSRLPKAVRDTARKS